MALPAIHGHQVGHQLPCHCQRRAIGVASLLLLVVERRQRRAVARRHLGGFDQCRLQMLVALLGDRRALRVVRGTLLIAAQPAVADLALVHIQAECNTEVPWGSLLGVLNQLAAEFSFSTPSAPPSTYTFKYIQTNRELETGDCSVLSLLAPESRRSPHCVMAVTAMNSHCG